jgi:hypothetical protein
MVLDNGACGTADAVIHSIKDNSKLLAGDTDHRQMRR